MRTNIFILTSIFFTFASSYAKDVTTDSLSNDSTANETMLNEIVVKAPLIRREADRIVLNVSANPLSANKNVQELLQTAPGVWADDNGVSIYGQGGTTVYIDDRRVNMSGNQLMTYLKSLQSSSIATIEIIPKAGAEYSADSLGGVIRINLKRNRIDGLSGSAGINLTSGKYKQWINPFLNFGLHSGKWTISLNCNLNGCPSDKYTSYDESTNSIIAQNMSGVSRHSQKILQGNGMFGIFYEPSDKDKLGLQFDYNTEGKKATSDSETLIYDTDSESYTFGYYRSKERFHNCNTSFNWSHSYDDKGSALKLIASYNHQKSTVKSNNEMNLSFIPLDSIYRTDNLNRYNIYVTELSFRKVFNPEWSLNVGAKYTFNNISNKSFHHYLNDDSWIPDNQYDYDTSYNENIIGLYAAAVGKAARWRFKAGIRAEYYKTTVFDTNKDSFDIFPNANIVFNISENGDYTVGLGYHRNIGRPSFRALNPTVIQVSDYYYSVGNPRLTQSLSNGFSLDFLIARKFTVAAGYSENDKPIRQVFTNNPEYPERMYLTWRNEGKDRNFYIHADGFINITNWWNLYSSVTYIVKSQKLTMDEPYETFGYLQFVASTSFSLPKGLNITANCFYTTKMKIGNITVYPILNINPTIQKRFGKHWSVSLGLENMLQRKNRLRNSSSAYDRYLLSKSHIAFKLGATYNFSSGKKFKTKHIEKNIDNSRLSIE